MIINKDTKLFVEKGGLPGVKRVAGKLAEDLKDVFGSTVAPIEADAAELLNSNGSEVRIIAVTLGNSELLSQLISEGKFDENAIKGKWEVYSFGFLPGDDNTLLIAGSDKRGTIYGLFHVSELMGVSPWKWFADVTPLKKDSIEITAKDLFVSKVPSVKYRGFFINDEWPAFGNWTFEHFGGFTAEMYDHVFELLLRLKGNYLWPAMWTSNFSLDGPGLANAELADEYGVVMSNSHHEPCLRHSEEWDLVKGEDTPYGTAWNFDKNKEGLTNYWRGGLERNGKFENIITMGMRGERDSEVLGATATLKDNIDYIKEVVTTQNQLIKETISEDLDSVPRMIAIYKEVEKYFHGDENAEGLKHWDGLDGITCMLCEDNFGNLRTLPEEWHRDRKGGWGMYYHFDYHGDPISYEWINSTHIARTCEQMSQAYEYGIREIWIVNVGDLKPQEFPLSYFMDLAYDIDKWGVLNAHAVEDYTKLWVSRQFPAHGAYSAEIVKLLDGYTHLNYTRKPEALNDRVYHPSFYGEADTVIKAADELIKKACELKANFEGSDEYDAFYQLIYFPVRAGMNVLKMQLFAGKNHMYANQGALIANSYASKVTECISLDRELTSGYHALNGGKWNGLMLSEHIGFVHWNDEECAYPLRAYVESANKPRMIVSAANDPTYSMGGDWTRKKLIIDCFLSPLVSETCITVSSGSEKEVSYEITGGADWLSIEKRQGKLFAGDLKYSDEKYESLMSDRISLKLDRNALKASADLKDGCASCTLTVKEAHTHVDIEVWAGICEDKDLVPILTSEQLGAEKPRYVKDPVVSNELGITIEAESLKLGTRTGAGEGEYRALKNFGKYGSGIKAFPTDKYFTPGKDAPYAEYSFKVGKQSAPDEETGETFELLATLITAPGNPVVKGNPMAVGVSVNGDKIMMIPTLEPGYEGGERTSPQWANGVLTQDHKKEFLITAKAGINTIRIYAADPGVVIERLLLRQAGTNWAEGYLGKVPTWIKAL